MDLLEQISQLSQRLREAVRMCEYLQMQLNHHQESLRPQAREPQIHKSDSHVKRNPATYTYAPTSAVESHLLSPIQESFSLQATETTSVMISPRQSEYSIYGRV